MRYYGWYSSVQRGRRRRQGQEKLALGPLAGLPDGVYRISPSKSGCVFDPRVRVVTVAGANLTGRGFRVVRVS